MLFKTFRSAVQQDATKVMCFGCVHSDFSLYPTIAVRLDMAHKMIVCSLDTQRGQHTSSILSPHCSLHTFVLYTFEPISALFERMSTFFEWLAVYAHLFSGHRMSQGAIQNPIPNKIFEIFVFLYQMLRTVTV